MLSCVKDPKDPLQVMHAGITLSNKCKELWDTGAVSHDINDAMGCRHGKTGTVTSVGIFIRLENKLLKVDVYF